MLIQKAQTIGRKKRETKTPEIVTIDTQNIESVLRIKSKQFNFDCGVIMSKINIPSENKFGLSWHYEKTSNFEDFLSSIRQFIMITDNKLTKGDVKNLENEYNSL